LVLGVYAEGALGPYGQALDESAGGMLAQTIAALEFSGEPSSSQLVALSQGDSMRQILLFGLGEPDKSEAPLEWQMLGGGAVQAAVAVFDHIPPLVFDADADHLPQLAYGAKLGSYYFDKYITDDERQHSQASMEVVSGDAERVRSTFSTSAPEAFMIVGGIKESPREGVHQGFGGENPGQCG